jgi:hypothetical protein
MCRGKMIAREIKEEPIEIKDQVTTISTDHRYGQTHWKIKKNLNLRTMTPNYKLLIEEIEFC